MKRFTLLVLVFLLLIVCGLGLVALLGGDGGSLPFAYEGFD